MTLEEMERRMTARELEGWRQLFAYIIPMPDQTREAAHVAWYVAMANSTKKVRFEDVMLKPPLAEGPEQTQEQQRAIFDRHAGG